MKFETAEGLIVLPLVFQHQSLFTIIRHLRKFQLIFEAQFKAYKQKI